MLGGGKPGPHPLGDRLHLHVGVQRPVRRAEAGEEVELVGTSACPKQGADEAVLAVEEVEQHAGTRSDRPRRAAAATGRPDRARARSGRLASNSWVWRARGALRPGRGSCGHPGTTETVVSVDGTGDMWDGGRRCPGRHPPAGPRGRPGLGGDGPRRDVRGGSSAGTRSFEALVAGIVAAYAADHRPGGGRRAWIAEVDGRSRRVRLLRGRWGSSPPPRRPRSCGSCWSCPDARGCGVGARLVAACLDFARARPGTGASPCGPTTC